jgi:hypothetical protein
MLSRNICLSARKKYKWIFFKELSGASLLAVCQKANWCAVTAPSAGRRCTVTADPPPTSLRVLTRSEECVVFAFESCENLSVDTVIILDWSAKSVALLADYFCCSF